MIFFKLAIALNSMAACDWAGWLTRIVALGLSMSLPTIAQVRILEWLSIKLERQAATNSERSSKTFLVPLRRRHSTNLETSLRG